MKGQSVNGLFEGPIEVNIREFIYQYFNVEGLPYPQNVSCKEYNIWKFAMVFEDEAGVGLNDDQLKMCKTIEDLVNLCTSAVIKKDECVESQKKIPSNHRRIRLIWR